MNNYNQPEVLYVPMEKMYPLIAEMLDYNGEATFTVSGISMQPMIINRRDSVTLSKVQLPLRKYDLPFYRLDNDKFILHRVVKLNKDGTYKCRGDNCLKAEDPIRDEQIIGIATKFIRNGKVISCNNIFYRIYCFYIVNSFPIRKVWRIKLRPFLGRVKRRIFNKKSS